MSPAPNSTPEETLRQEKASGLERQSDRKETVPVTNLPPEPAIAAAPSVLANWLAPYVKHSTWEPITGQRHPFAGMSFEQIAHLIQININEQVAPLRAELAEYKRKEGEAMFSSDPNKATVPLVELLKVKAELERLLEERDAARQVLMEHAKGNVRFHGSLVGEDIVQFKVDAGNVITDLEKQLTQLRSDLQTAKERVAEYEGLLAGDLRGKLTRVGTFLIHEEETTGFVVSCHRENLASIQRLPMYRDVVIVPVDAALAARQAGKDQPTSQP